MEMSQVRYFLALRTERNFTRAARRCAVSQPSLTQAIKALERELGRKLFERRRDGARLTPFGTEIEPCFDAIARCVDEIEQRARQVFAADTVPGAADPNCACANREVSPLIDLTGHNAHDHEGP